MVVKNETIELMDVALIATRRNKSVLIMYLESIVQYNVAELIER